MPPQLPTPGQDSGSWGTMLNNFLSVSLNSDGTLNSTQVAAAGGGIGATGPAGATGATGASGTPGSVGATGASGASGATGPSGPAGATGASGASGSNGAVGATGASGASGATGTLGSTGSVGATGATGATGPTGSAGSVLVSAVQSTNTSFVSSAPVLQAGTTVVDGYTVASGDIVLLVAQSTASQNGLWQVPASGSVGIRPTSFAHASTNYGLTVNVLNGIGYQNSAWLLYAPSAGVVIDTGSQTWNNLMATMFFETAVRSNNSLDEMASPQANINMNQYTFYNLPSLTTTGAVSAASVTSSGAIKGPTDTSGTAIISSPTFTTATYTQCSTSQDVMLYIYENSSIIWNIYLSSTNSGGTQVYSAATAGAPGTGSALTIRVPKGWYVSVTCATMTKLTITQVTC